MSGLSQSQIKVLEKIYLTTDCSNGVWDYAKLHWTQARIADGMKGMVRTSKCVMVDGDGFVGDTERWGVGYQLTRMGYEALTAHDTEAYPVRNRRFANSTQ